jgi:hypothetical protein
MTLTDAQIEMIELRAKLNLLVRLESAISRMKILHESKWIEVDDYREFVANRLKEVDKIVASEFRSLKIKQ